jgi:hypothetical protein
LVWHFIKVIEPQNHELRFERARVFFLVGESRFGVHDLRQIISDPMMRDKIQSLIKELNEKGRVTEAWQVQRLLDHGDSWGL